MLTGVKESADQVRPITTVKRNKRPTTIPIVTAILAPFERLLPVTRLTGRGALDLCSIQLIKLQPASRVPSESILPGGRSDADLAPIRKRVETRGKGKL